MPVNTSVYPPNWEEIAEAAKTAAGYRCEACGRRARGRGIGVHHLDFNPGNNQPWNLAVLCRECHLALHGDERRYDPNRPPTGMLWDPEADPWMAWWTRRVAEYQACAAEARERGVDVRTHFSSDRATAQEHRRAHRRVPKDLGPLWADQDPGRLFPVQQREGDGHA